MGIKMLLAVIAGALVFLLAPVAASAEGGNARELVITELISLVPAPPSQAIVVQIIAMMAKEMDRSGCESGLTGISLEAARNGEMTIPALRIVMRCLVWKSRTPRWKWELELP